MGNFGAGPTYDPVAVQPMRDQLNLVGIRVLLTKQEVDEAFGQEGTVLLIVNSVCGCAAGNARPGAMMALQNEKIPDHLTTVFAGVDNDAVMQARNHFLPYPPSSPSIALLKDGKLVHFLERHHIEGRTAEMIAEHLKTVYSEFC